MPVERIGLGSWAVAGRATSEDWTVCAGGAVAVQLDGTASAPTRSAAPMSAYAPARTACPPGWAPTGPKAIRPRVWTAAWFAIYPSPAGSSPPDSLLTLCT